MTRARIVVVLGAFTLVEILCRVGIIDRVTLIPPSAMVVSLYQLIASGRVNGDIVFTAYDILAAFVLAIVGGSGIGSLLHALPRLRHVVEPLLSAYYAIPTFVFYPLLIVAFGVGRAPLIVIGAIFGIVVMIVHTMLGLDRVPPAVTKSAAIMKLSRIRRYFLVMVPAATPHLVSGIKLAVAYSVIGVVAGEFILATQGIGKQISFAYDNFDNRTMYGLLLLLLFVVTCVNAGLSTWERRLHRRFGLR